MIDQYRIEFLPFVDEVHLMVTGPKGRMRAELSLRDATKLLMQLTKAMNVAADWQPTEGLAGLLE